MFSKIGAFVLVTLYLFTGLREAQACVPENVATVRVEADRYLRWFVRLGTACEPTHFRVSIFHPGQHVEYEFLTAARELDVSFLEICEEWVFVVVTIAGDTIGAELRVTQMLPVPADMNLTVSDLSVKYNTNTGLTHLQWGLADPQLRNCSLEYRVTFEEDGSPVILSQVVNTQFIDLHFLSSCVTYQFGVRAINVAPPAIEGPISTVIQALPGRKQFPPVLIHSEVGATSANLLFRLESEVRNPCQLKTLYVDGGAFSQNIALSNEGVRQPVNVTLPDLLPDTKYSLRVYVSNVVGWSNATEIDMHTLSLSLDNESEQIEE